MIDYAEALTVIDVNTGSFTGKGKAARLEDTITKTNLEAAEEVVNQLRLRDIGGIIVIDFIDMARARNRDAVLKVAAQVARRGPHEDLRGRDLAARPGRDDAPERHRRRARDHDQAVPGLRRRGRRQVRGDDRDRGRARTCATWSTRPATTARRPTCCASTRASPRWFTADGARELHALEDETGQLLPLRGLRGPAARPLRGDAWRARARRSSEHAVPFRAGEEVHVDIVEPHMYNAGRRGRQGRRLPDRRRQRRSPFVGEKKLVRIEEAGRTAAGAVLTGADAEAAAAAAEERAKERAKADERAKRSAAAKRGAASRKAREEAEARGRPRDEARARERGQGEGARERRGRAEAAPRPPAQAAAKPDEDGAGVEADAVTAPPTRTADAGPRPRPPRTREDGPDDGDDALSSRPRRRGRRGGRRRSRAKAEADAEVTRLS